jgi:hypothetical protein
MNSPVRSASTSITDPPDEEEKNHCPGGYRRGGTHLPHPERTLSRTQAKQNKNKMAGRLTLMIGS